MSKNGAALIVVLILATARTAWAQGQTCAAAKYGDSHFRLTN